MKTHNTAPPSNLKTKIKKALDDWHKPNTGKSSLDDLYLFRKRLRDTQLNHRRVANEILLEGIQKLEDESADHALFLQQRFLDNMHIVAIAQDQNIGESTVYVVQKQAIAWLSTVIWDMEREQRRRQQARMLNRLEPPTYVELIGVKEHQGILLGKIESPDAPYILSITGMGGLGKTSLADSIIRRVIEEGQFDDVGWFTARQQQLNLMAQIEVLQSATYNVETIIRELCHQLMPDFPLPTNFILKDAIDALEKYLNQHPHFIVIDNLETVEDIRDLFPILGRLANPSKFLLTSRESLHAETNVYHYPAPSLNEADSLQLIRQEAELSNAIDIAKKIDEELHPVYQTVGGNPLALRLVVGLAHHDDLQNILNDLQVAHNDTADQLYTYIYRQAWEKLDEQSRKVLLTMSIIKPSGGGLDIVTHNSGLDQRDVQSSLKALAVLSLVNVHKAQNGRNYSIHSLTKSFLLEQVLLWT